MPQKREWTPLLLPRCSWHLLICQVFSRPPGNLGMPLASQEFESKPIDPINRAVPALPLLRLAHTALKVAIDLTVTDAIPFLKDPFALPQGQLDLREAVLLVQP